MSDMEVREGQFVVSRGWSEFTLDAIRADIVSPKLIRQRSGFTYKGKPRFTQIHRDAVMAVFDTAEEAAAAVEAARTINAEHSMASRALREQTRAKFDALVAGLQAGCR